MPHDPMEFHPPYDRRVNVPKVPLPSPPGQAASTPDPDMTPGEVQTSTPAPAAGPAAPAVGLGVPAQGFDDSRIVRALERTNDLLAMILRELT